MEFRELDSGSADRVLMHNSSRRFWVTLFSSIAFLSLVLVVASIAANGVMEAPLLVLLLISVLLCLIRVARNGVELTDECVVIRRLGKRKIPWSNIEDIDIRQVQGMRQAQVIEKGNRIRHLPVPSDRWPLREKQFDEKLELLRRYWTAHR